MTTHPLRSTFFFGFTLTASLLTLGVLTSSTAHAAGSLVVTSNLPQSLGGDTPYLYDTVTIESGAVLSVIPVGTADGTGRLHIKANRITIKAGGILDASGAGYRGVSGAAGDGAPGGGGGYSTDAAGGGGAYFGNGGEGTNAACAMGIFAAGGTKYGMPGVLGLGSAGGAGGKSPGPIGGSGGGSIILDAAEIEIFGTITAAGDPGLSISGVGSGGGAGGEIRLQASKFTWGTTAKLLAHGGLGGKALNSSGGSGGGGLIWLRGSPAPIPEVQLDVSGGASAEGCATGEGKGQDGVVDQDSAAVDCRDLDGDTFTAQLCGGPDCDDADPAIKPGAKEDCDVYDNDCNGKVNDGDNVCAAGLVCKESVDETMQTVFKCDTADQPDAGLEDASTSAAPEVVEYRGGCSVPSTPIGAAPLAALGLAVALGAHITRRNRRRP